MELEHKRIKSAAVVDECDHDSFISKIDKNRQDTLLTGQNGNTNYVQEDARQIFDRIVRIAKEIGWLCEQKSPVENDSANPVAK